MLAVQNLLRRKVRTLFALLGIAVGISAVVSIVSTAKGVRGQFYRIADQFGYDVIVQSRGAASPMVSAMSPKDEKRVAALPGVRSIDPLRIQLVFSADESRAQPVLMLGLDPRGDVLKRYEIVRGRGLVPEDQNAVVVGELFAQQLKLSVGSKLETRDVVGSYDVVGIFHAPVAGVDMLGGQAIGSLEFLCSKLDVRPNLIMAHLRTEEEAKAGQGVLDLRQLDAAIAAIGSALATDPKTKDRLEAKAFKSYLDSFKQLDLIDKFAWAMSFLAALVGGIGIANTMLMSVFERTREIGLLRAVGWSRRRIAGLIVLEGLVLSLAGGALGVPLGWLEVLAATKVVEMGWIPSMVEPSVALQAVLLATVIGVLGSLYPGLRAASLEPTEALRYE
jgi:putative ABC transport system permease protein